MPVFNLDPNKWYSSGEIALYFDVSVRTVNGWIESGEMVGIQAGGPKGHYKVLGQDILAAQERWRVQAEPRRNASA